MQDQLSFPDYGSQVERDLHSCRLQTLPFDSKTLSGDLRYRKKRSVLSETSVNVHTTYFLYYPVAMFVVTFVRSLLKKGVVEV